MPETHERQREKSDSLYGGDSIGGTYTLPNFAFEAPLTDVRKNHLLAVNRDTLDRKGHNQCNEQIKDALSDVQQQTTQNDSQGFLKLDYNESGDTEDVLSAPRNIGKDFSSRAESNRERGHNGFSTEREISLPNGKKLFTHEGNNSRSLHEKLSVKHVDTSSSILGQRASYAVCDVVQPMNENIRMDEKVNLRRRGSSGSELQEAQNSNFKTLAPGSCSLQDSNEARVDPLTAEIPNVRGQNRLNRKDDRGILVQNAPLVFPQESDLALSKQTTSKVDHEPSRSLGTTPCGSNTESVITRDAEKIKQTGLTDSFKGNQPDNTLSDANDRSVQILVQTHPDGGWGWVVCFGAFIVQFIALGMQNTAGIVYTELVKELKTPRGATGW